MTTIHDKYSVTEEEWGQLSPYKKLILFSARETRKTASLGFIYYAYAFFLGFLIPLYVIIHHRGQPSSATTLTIVAFIGFGLTLYMVAQPLLGDSCEQIKNDVIGRRINPHERNNSTPTEGNRTSPRVPNHSITQKTFKLTLGGITITALSEIRVTAQP